MGTIKHTFKRTNFYIDLVLSEGDSSSTLCISLVCPHWMRILSLSPSKEVNPKTSHILKYHSCFLLGADIAHYYSQNISKDTEDLWPSGPLG